MDNNIPKKQPFANESFPLNIIILRFLIDFPIYSIGYLIVDVLLIHHRTFIPNMIYRIQDLPPYDIKVI